MQIVDAVHNVLERTPGACRRYLRPRYRPDGGRFPMGLDALIEEKTGITTMIAEDPLTAVAIGTGKFIEFPTGNCHQRITTNIWDELLFTAPPKKRKFCDQQHASRCTERQKAVSRCTSGIFAQNTHENTSRNTNCEQ